MALLAYGFVGVPVIRPFNNTSSSSQYFPPTSGRRATRSATLAALDDLRTDGAGVLVVAKRDRLARDVVVAAMIERLVERAGAKVMSATGACELSRRRCERQDIVARNGASSPTTLSRLFRRLASEAAA